MVIAKRSAAAKCSDLRKHRIGINQHPAPAELLFRDAIHIAEVEVKICFATARRQLGPTQATRGAVLGQVTDVANHTVPPQKLEQIGDTETWIGRINIAWRLVTGVRPAEVFEIRHLVPELLKSGEVLEMVPNMAAQREPNHVP